MEEQRKKEAEVQRRAGPDTRRAAPGFAGGRGRGGRGEGRGGRGRSCRISCDVPWEALARCCCVSYATACSRRNSCDHLSVVCLGQTLCLLFLLCVRYSTVPFHKHTGTGRGFGRGGVTGGYSTANGRYAAEGCVAAACGDVCMCVCKAVAFSWLGSNVRRGRSSQVVSHCSCAMMAFA